MAQAPPGGHIRVKDLKGLCFKIKVWKFSFLGLLKHKK